MNEYIRRVRAAGGFAEIHGTGTGRHAHSVPAGDTTISRSGNGPVAQSINVTVPVTVYGRISARDIDDLVSELKRHSEEVMRHWQQRKIARGTG